MYTRSKAIDISIIGRATCRNIDPFRSVMIRMVAGRTLFAPLPSSKDTDEAETNHKEKKRRDGPRIAYLYHIDTRPTQNRPKPEPIRRLRASTPCGWSMCPARVGIRYRLICPRKSFRGQRWVCYRDRIRNHSNSWVEPASTYTSRITYLSRQKSIRTPI